ncbi:hypothetical protein Tco_0870027 [Tanacetum coccineum]
MPRDCLRIIESKSKVRNSRNKPVVAKVIQPLLSSSTYQAQLIKFKVYTKGIEFMPHKGITTRSGVAYKGPTIPTTSSPKVVERETEVTKDTMPPTNNGSTKDVQPLVVPVVHHESISEPVNAPDQMLERLCREFKSIVSSMAVLELFSNSHRPDRTRKNNIYLPIRTFAIAACLLGLCDASARFQRCMMAIFQDMIEKNKEVFMVEFSVFEDSFLIADPLGKMLI